MGRSVRPHGHAGGHRHTELNAVLNDATVREKLRAMGIEPSPGSADQYRDEVKRDLDRYGPVVKAAGISVE